MKIQIAGLGAYDPTQMTLGVYKAIQQADVIFTRTSHHPAHTVLLETGKEIISFDSVYEHSETFEDVYVKIANTIIEESEDKGSILYCVPGHPLVAEKSVQLLLEKGREKGISIDILGGRSFLEDLFSTLSVDPVEGFQLLDGMSFAWKSLQLHTHTFIMQVFNRFVASDVKLQLLEKWPPETKVCVVTAAGSAEERVDWVPLHELDHEDRFTDYSTLYVPPAQEKSQRLRDFSQLRELISTLRGPEGCPWDQKQTHQTLKRFLLEETYEVWDAIDDEDDEQIADELGDILLQVLLHAQIGEEEGRFSLEDVIASLSAKMIRRHPHVFADVSIHSEGDIHANWDAIKAKEKGAVSHESRLDGVPNAASTLQTAYDLQKKAAKAGFDWECREDLWAKVQEEIAELDEELHHTSAEDQSSREEEWGDVMFVLVNMARHYGIHPEVALQKTIKKFTCRFQFIEKQVAKDTKAFEEYTLEELDVFWEQAKRRRKRMRLDKFLKVSRLIKRRTLAKDVAEQGRVAVNGQPAKASTKVKVGDTVAIQYGNRTTIARIDKLVETTKKEASGEMYTILEEK
ncbi:nucleoside triphosphate pyrophosphohydrolase [Bacillaceae bacterium SIJ1]|uniref:nucleoside triphosphate pyrophosphohydrolase n=1 Tax=Litoribacterium kuwaitense TaxID=1398745 RepID=UPI0013EA678C|nr:nucleoside triphosphate pyrophosphohydrolase [Litoribacterium kuwaitense]NGP45805.1 nucleoside triphosphate pyrophosphohydrolase [Litoribacterium kuwaitense]